MSRFIRERLRDLAAYVPGEQPKNSPIIKLNTNESPYPPGNEVLKSVDQACLTSLNLYPSPDQSRLKKAIGKWLSADLYGDSSISENNIFVSNGSDDIINFAFMAFAGEETIAYFPDLTYGFYEVFANFQGVEYVKFPVGEDFSVNPQDYIFDDDEQRLIVIANPNAPTGLALGLKEIEGIVYGNPNSVVLVDEAYIDFGGETAAGLVNKYDNLIVSRTFSKFASLAGARLGFAVAGSELISDLEKIKYANNPYSINRMTEEVGLAAIGEIEYYNNNCKKIIETREWTKNELENLGLAVTPSKANFLFVGTGKEVKNSSFWRHVSGEELSDMLRSKGILIRWFNGERTKDYIRISIGTENDMKVLIDTLKDIINN